LVVPPLIADSVTQLSGTARNRVVIGGSHCGLYAAYVAARAGVRAVILNDAGVGRDRAGVAGLGYLGDLGIPAATVDCRTARIGDGRDSLERGVISFANGLAADLGCRPGLFAADAAQLLARAPERRLSPPTEIEARHRIAGPWDARVSVWALDSVSLVQPCDAGAIVVTGSHGGLLGGDPRSALKVDALAALYNDATGGIDGAGFSRLPALDQRGIAAATVDAMRARIGDGMSTYEDGVLTHVNETAARLGACVGMTVRKFVELLVARKLRSTQ
jgi:hypothetical protein